MKIAISTSAASLDSLVDPRFGRAARFVIFDTEAQEWTTYPNPALNAKGGAGVQAAQFIASHGAQVAISGDFGPNAYKTLSAAGVQMFQVPSGTAFTARELLVRYRRRQLKQATAPNRPGYHSPRGSAWMGL
jgi:predicted Fe-Mo cluster-binding NifX family protein